MAAPGTGNKSLKDYLKKYESSDVVEKRKKKKQKKSSKPEPKGVLVVDEDPVWQKPVDPEEDENENDSAGKLLDCFLFLGLVAYVMFHFSDLVTVHTDKLCFFFFFGLSRGKTFG